MAQLQPGPWSATTKSGRTANSSNTSLQASAVARGNARTSRSRVLRPDLADGSADGFHATSATVSTYHDGRFARRWADCVQIGCSSMT